MGTTMANQNSGVTYRHGDMKFYQM